MLQEIKQQSELNELLKTKNTRLIFNFYASWAEPCQHMNQVFAELSKKYESNTSISFHQVEAENFAETCEQFEISAVPSFIVYDPVASKIVDQVQGANPSQLLTLVEKISTWKPSSVLVEETNQPQALQNRLKQLTTCQKLMIFIKGSPTQPKCKFSRALIELLNATLPPHIGYGSFNILADEQVRAGLKEFSDWPTFPQIYLDGEFIGGLDIFKELVDSGEFLKMLPQEEISPEEETLNDRLKRLINQSQVMIFIKGTPTSPKCGFSNQLIQILNQQGIKFDYFDILTDEDVRSGLKVYSNWPTFPQVYVNGELIGGLDIVKEMIEMGEKII